MEPWHGRGGGEPTAGRMAVNDYEGLRIFDVAVNGETLVDDLDPWAEAGYCGAMKRVVSARAKDGRLRVSFPEVKAGQAVICGIAIASRQDTRVAPLTSPSSWKALDTDTIAKLPQELLPQDTEARPASVYEPVKQSGQKASKTTFIIKPGLGQEYALRFRYKNVSGHPTKARLTIIDSKRTTLVDRELTFPPTPAKFKMLSTTTGTQINAGTYRLTVEADGLEFKNLEIQ